jgi:hypothetical protein
MQEIPVPYVRANQAGMVLFVLLAIVLQQPWLITVLWIIQVLGLAFGLKANVFIQLAKPFLASRIAGAQTEARELLRFNQSIAVVLLTVSVIFLWINAHSVIGYVAAGMVGVAALVAICGFCVGCFLYYQLKMRMRRFKS